MKEIPNNLRSRQYAKVVDLISEGPIRGVVNGMKGVYLDGTVLQEPGGAMTFKNTSVQFVNGYATQPIMTGFASQEAEENVSLELRKDTPLIRNVANPDCDRARVIVSVPQLSNTDTNSGDVDGDFVEYRIEVQPLGKAYQLIGNFRIDGKTMSRYQRSHLFGLPGVGPWNIRVSRTSDEPLGTDRQTDIFWDSFVAIIDDRVNYNRCACVGVKIDAEQFGTVPKRVYLTDGILCNIPSNYDPFKATYSGTWDGTFKLEWTNNPAWIFYDLLINNRYGLGSFVLPAMVDKWSLYKIGVFCDQLVNNGKGGKERRFTCNIQIMDQREAFDLLSQICSVFRGFAYWAGAQIIANADDPSDPVMQYTNANVLDGAFTYAGADIRGRHTMVSTGWADPSVLGEPRFAVVENPEQLSRWGIQRLDDPGFGSTSESQSIRTGKWTLYTEEHESETVAFRCGLDTAWTRPGDIIQIADVNIAGVRFGGRVGAGSTASHIVPDAMPAMSINTHYLLSCMIGEGVVQTRDASTGAVLDPTGMNVSPAFSAAPKPDTVFVLNEVGDVEPTTWRVMGVRQADQDIYEVTALRHYPQKWAVIEQGVVFADQDISAIVKKPPAPTNLAVREYLVALSPISVGVRVVFSWKSNAPQFDVYWRRNGVGNWSIRRTDAQSIDLEVIEGKFEFRVVAISNIGVKSEVSSINYEVIGRYAPPQPPKMFRIKVSDGVALFEWLPATELDVIIGGHFELRHSSKTSGATWNTAQTVVPSIPGNATTVETVYRSGTWFLRTFDIVGTPSTTAAIVIALNPDGRYTEFARICEDPEWLGTRLYTEVLDPQRWLVLGQTGGLWDAQMDNMDDWPDVDVLSGGPPEPQDEARVGWYEFNERIDAGGVFSVRFTTDITAFPYQDGSDFIDDRLDDCDNWANWDQTDADLTGQVQLYIRLTNDDPASPSATWSEWQPYSPMEYTARGFEFRAVLSAPKGQNIAVEQLCITADLRMKMDSGEDIPYAAAIKHVTFNAKFYLVPAVVVTVQNALETDRIQVLSKTREGFDLSITNSGGVHQTRTFDWQARGY